MSTLDSLRACADDLRKEINPEVACLDGTPFVVQVTFPDGVRMLYGEPYEDQIAAGKTRRGCRLQRTFTLCGAICMDREGANKVRAALDAQFALDYPGGKCPWCVIMHRRDWFLQELESLQTTIKCLEAAAARGVEL